MKRALALAIALLSPLAARAQVSASLVSSVASVRAGQPFTVALRLDHKPHWHTYWVNPGTGLTIKWNLPEGWKAGDIEWPAPRLLTDSRGNLIGNGYEGDQLLPVQIVPPPTLKPGAEIPISAAVDWLMCQDECVPGNAKVSITLPVSDGAPAADPAWGPRIQSVLAQLPAAVPGWTLSATRAADSVTLFVQSTSSSGGAARAASGVHFFSEDGMIASDVPQKVVSDGSGGFTLTLPISPDGPKDAARLVGVVTSSEGWRADGGLPGLTVNVPFGELTKAEPAPAPGGFARTLVLAFLGGLILNLMPCVFPVLGIKILGFVNQAGADRRKVTMHGLVFTSGVVLSFWVLAAVLAILRAGGSRLGWGFQLQSPEFVFGLAAAMLAFGLNMSGVF
jgi:thiol:disulfide interchange protein DsbD